MGLRTLVGVAAALVAATTAASGGAKGSAAEFSFRSLDGGTIELAEFAGRPVLVVNTASRCGFVGQFEGLQALQDRYADRGLTVLGVPSDSFRQELDTVEAVKEFCEVNFSIDFPMTEITPVAGSSAHPFYAWARSQGAGPWWNFHKILIDGSGAIAGSYGPTVAPDSPRLIAAIEAALPAQ
jgi:glutathione peroxidase